MQSETQHYFRNHESHKYNSEKQYDQIVYKEATVTISHLRIIRKYLQQNFDVPQQKPVKNLSGKKVNVEHKNSRHKTNMSNEQRIAIYRYFQQIGTTGDEVIKSLKDIASQIQFFLSQEVDYSVNSDDNEENRTPSMRRSFSAKNSKQANMRGQFVAQIFDYINNQYFSNMNIEGLLQEKQLKKLAIYILQVQTKLSTLPVFVNSIMTMKADIATCEPFFEAYKNVWDHVIMINAGDKSNNGVAVRQKAQLDYASLKFMLKITTAAVVTEQMTSQIQWIRKLVFGVSFPRFYCSGQEAQLRCYKIWRCPKVNELNSVWNLSQRGALRYLKNLVFPKIKTKLQIFVPILSKEDIQKMIQKQGSFDHNKYEKLDIFQQPANEQSIAVLILNPYQIKLNPQFEKHSNFYCCSCYEKTIPQDYYDTIVIHIHGGGFVALSSDTMQTYTRRWANGIKVPIFSINYRKPPQFRFPHPIFDCLSAYIFIIQYIQRYMNVRPKKVVIGGDSAGGNLACAITAILIKMNFPVLPIGLLLAYPAIDMRQRYSPSRLNAFQDALLLPTLLLLCQKQYLGENSLLQYEPLASPILLTQQYIKRKTLFNYDSNKMVKSYKQNDGKFPSRWPKTTIMVGKKDPLYDDSLRLLQRLVNSGISAKMLLYRDFSHGFLSLNGFIPACDQTIQEAISEIKLLLDIK